MFSAELINSGSGVESDEASRAGDRTVAAIAAGRQLPRTASVPGHQCRWVSMPLGFLIYVFSCPGVHQGGTEWLSQMPETGFVEKGKDSNGKACVNWPRVARVFAYGFFFHGPVLDGPLPALLQVLTAQHDGAGIHKQRAERSHMVAL